MANRKRFAPLLAMLVMCGGGLAAAAEAPHAEIARSIAAMGVAARAHDTDRFMEPFLRSPSLVFVINGQVIRGWDALHAAQLVWWKGGKSDVVYTPVGDTEFADIAPDVVLTTRQLRSRRTGPDGKPSLGTCAITAVWKKGSDGWRIVYGHESWAR